MPAPPLPPSNRRRPTHMPVAVKTAPRIFICDDNLEFAQELAEALEANGFETRTLAGNRPPTQIVDGFLPDMILLDIYMPPPDGFEMINHIRDASGCKDVPLVLMSGADPGLMEVASRFCIARNVRLAAAFRKPVDLGNIIRICNIHVGR